MPSHAPRPRPVFLGALALVIAWSGVSVARRERARGEVLAFTECPFRGPARVVIRSDLATADTLPVRVHEQVHAAQCESLGPVRYRLRNLTGSGRLSLEVPAYCAAAEARLRMNGGRFAVRERMFDDIHAAFHGIADSVKVARAIARGCPRISVRVALAT